MGSSESGGEREVGVGNSVAGSIVWVRRRNGSWWPGKILGPDELSASHLMSPRSGTPVKLLGREDASVDWYNLEKSKRVKAFRCGEFDDCIERAEASLGLPAKKREKYARREDAILHALELEKQFIEKKFGKLVNSNSIRENVSDTARKGLATTSGAVENGNCKMGNHELYQDDRKVDMSNMKERNNTHAHKATEGTSPSLEEHNTEASRRIRGLQDFGLGAVPVNRMVYSSAAFDDSNRMAIDGHAYAVSTSDPFLENSSDSDSRNSIDRGKRLLEGFVEESGPKRHNRHHSFVKVMRNSGELPDRSLQPDGDFVSLYGNEQIGDRVRRSLYLQAESSEIFDTNQVPQAQMEMSVSQFEMGNFPPQHSALGEETTSGSSEETESDSSETHSLEPPVEAGMMLSDAETRIRPQHRILDRLEMQGVHESTSGDESEELPLAGRSRFRFHDRNSSATGVSKWQLKGKRNVRNFSKRPMDKLANRTSYLEGRDRSLSQRTPPSHGFNYYHHDNDYANDADIIEDDFDPHTPGLGKRGYMPLQASVRRQNFIGQNLIDWEELTWGRPFSGFLPTFLGRNGGRDMLIDVDLRVQANRQGEHVPWVSLMSRLNGKAIIGHPIQIEALEDGSTDILVSTSDTYGNIKDDFDKNRVPPVWRTARRTANFRVPRQLEGDGDAENRYFLPQSGKVRSKKSLGPNSFRNKKKTQKSKPRKGNSSSSSQKTKTLSSIGGFDQKLGSKRRENDTSYYMDRVINSGPPTVACIPVKLVFSRLLEAVGRPPSGPATKHGISANNNTQ